MAELISLRRWAAQQGIARGVAYRLFHRGQLVDRDGRPVWAKQYPNGSILVDPTAPPGSAGTTGDPLAHVTAEAIVEKLRQAGYVVLTLEQAKGLGVTVEEPPTV